MFKKSRQSNPTKIVVNGCSIFVRFREGCYSLAFFFASEVINCFVGGRVLMSLIGRQLKMAAQWCLEPQSCRRDGVELCGSFYASHGCLAHLVCFP